MREDVFDRPLARDNILAHLVLGQAADRLVQASAPGSHPFEKIRLAHRFAPLDCQPAAFPLLGLLWRRCELTASLRAAVGVLAREAWEYWRKTSTCPYNRYV